MPFTLTDRDEAKLNNVHPDLADVIRRAAELSPHRFRVTEGLRSLPRQKELVRIGASKTLNSRHLTGHAVDLVPYFDGDGDGDIDAGDMYAWPLYHQIAPIIKKAAKELGFSVEWGGDWVTFKDGPHWQLSRKTYPTRHADKLFGKPLQPKTVTREKSELIALGAGIVTAASSVGAEPLGKAAQTILKQQEELTSGDVTRIAVAASIVILTVWWAFRKKAD